MSADSELLRRYAEEGAEAAFAELVRLHVNLVYFAALRQLDGDTHRAQEVVSLVFTDLARKAATLCRRPTLSGWLHTSTRYAAANVRRAAAIRHKHEQEAERMSANSPEPEANAAWERLRPMIDAVITRLNAHDREAVLLRFFEGQSFAAIAAVLRVSEDAARMRVERALSKLRDALARRGVSSTSAALALALANSASATAPAGVAVAATTTALANAATGGALGAGAWLAFFTMSKIEIGIAGAIVIAAVALGGRELYAQRALREEIAQLSTADRDLASARAEARQTATDQAPAANSATNELARLRARLAQLNARPRWVVEAKMKSIAHLRESGWATDVAALETFNWARATNDRVTLANNFAWVGAAKAPAEKAFAQLSEAVRVKYGSADRLAGAALFSTGEIALGDFKWSRDGRLETSGSADDPLIGYWADSDPDAHFPRPGIMLRIRAWGRFASGDERPLTTDISYAGDGHWTIGPTMFSEEMWQRLLARIDPLTGELLPARVGTAP